MSKKRNASGAEDHPADDHGTSLEWMQRNLPSAPPYNQGMRKAGEQQVPHLAAMCAVLEATKAIGRIADMVEARGRDDVNDHWRDFGKRQIANAAGDAAIALMRIAEMEGFSLSTLVGMRVMGESCHAEGMPPRHPPGAAS